MAMARMMVPTRAFSQALRAPTMVRSFGSLTTRGVDDAITKELNDNTVPEYDLVADLNAKNPGTTIRWAGCNTWRTLEWILPHPPPFHTFEEQPIIKETVGPAAIYPRPPDYDPANDDPMEHSYHPGVHQIVP